jgi:hypothetical protein
MTATWHVGPISGAFFWWTLVTSPEILVFLFFMVTDPKTIPSTPRGRVVYALAVGLLASLLIAAARTEFWTKVAVLGALAIVCAVQPLPARLPTVRLHRRRLALVAAVALAGYIGAIAVAGIRARPAATAAPLAFTRRLPEIAIIKPNGVQTALDPRASRRIVVDLLADLELQGNALSQRRPAEFARATTGDELTALDNQLEVAKGGTIEAPAYRVESVRIQLEPGQGQGPAIAVAAIAGAVQMTDYKGLPPAMVRRDAPVPLRETLELQQNGGRWLVARVRRPVARGRTRR